MGISSKDITCLEKEKKIRKRLKGLLLASLMLFFWAIIGQRGQKPIQATPCLK